MARNLEVSIRIEMNETDAPLSANSEEAQAISSAIFGWCSMGTSLLRTKRVAPSQSIRSPTRDSISFPSNLRPLTHPPLTHPVLTLHHGIFQRSRQSKWSKRGRRLFAK